MTTQEKLRKRAQELEDEYRHYDATLLREAARVIDGNYLTIDSFYELAKECGQHESESYNDFMRRVSEGARRAPGFRKQRDESWAAQRTWFDQVKHGDSALLVACKNAGMTAAQALDEVAKESASRLAHLRRALEIQTQPTVIAVDEVAKDAT